ncbi:hypothetical protein B0H13DRAFT_1505177, partial [Mycena leptocephala]
YIVCCDGDHELYDMPSDPYQMDNLLFATSTGRALSPSAGSRTQSRRSAATLTGSCRPPSAKPWLILHMHGKVTMLADAMNPEFDNYYDGLAKIKYDACYPYYNAAAEG